MIDINLMPPSARKKTVSSVLSAFYLGIPQEIFIGVGAGFISLLLLVHLVLLGAWMIKGVVVSSYRAQWQAVLPDKNRIDVLGNEIKDLKKKIDGLTALTSTKATGWSRKLNIISDSLVSGLWLRRVNIDMKILTIEGTVISKNQSEIAAVGAFVDNLKKDLFFMQDVLSLEVGSIQRAKQGSTDVANFIVTAKLK